jgi:hypothetical protein
MMRDTFTLITAFIAFVFIAIGIFMLCVVDWKIGVGAILLATGLNIENQIVRPQQARRAMGRPHPIE